MTPPPSVSPGARRIDELEGLRGLLALWVAGSHVVCLCGLDASRPAWVPRSVWEWLVYAGTAVNAFVILSGFAIFKMLRSSPPSYRAFLTGRAFRLFPVYLTCFALALVLVPTSAQVAATAPWHGTDYFHRWAADLALLQTHWFSQLALQLPLLQGLATAGWPAPRLVTDVLPPAWSATLEWQFYLIAPLLLSYGPDRRSRTFLAALLAIGVVIALLLMANGATYGGFLGLKLWLFALGILSAHLHSGLDPAEPRAPRFWWLPAGAVGALLTYVFHDPAPLIWLAVFAVVLAPQSLFATGLGGLLRRRPLLWLGRISYSLYLLHWPLLVGAVALLLRFSPAIPARSAATALLLVALPAILGLAGLLHTKIEAPLMSYGRRLSRRQV